MNQYEFRFNVKCPVDGDMVLYHLTIRTLCTLPAEGIRDLCLAWKEGLHEDIADGLHKVLGGQQTLVATHRGVTITTTRG